MLKQHFVVCLTFCLATLFLLETSNAQSTTWSQWRGPSRDGFVENAKPWPNSLTDDVLDVVWEKTNLGPSYSGPVVSETAVFSTETVERKYEVATAYDRQTGETLWSVKWEGAMTVPFFALSNGSWIRATPVYDGQTVYVPGIRDVIVALDAETGAEKWKLDFVDKVKSPVPSFGFASSPLIDQGALYAQAGGAFTKIDAETGKILWQTLKDDGGMSGSAFSSPVIETIAGRRQAIVQTRQKLAGVDLESGDVLWEQVVPNYRGMNILTPLVHKDAVFTSSYRNKAWLYQLNGSAAETTVEQQWETNTQAYMSSPVLIEGYAYLHLQNQRFTCIDLKTGERTWTTTPFGKYWSMVAQGDKILALDQRGKLLLIKANPKQFELLDEREVTDEDSWAHLAVDGDQLVIRSLNGLIVMQWK